MAKKRKKSDTVSMPPLPEGFVSSMKDLLGESEAGTLFASLDEAPSVSIRINSKKVRDPEEFIKRFKDFSPERVPWCNSGYYLSGRPDFIHDPLLHAGCYYVQEAASMVYESIVSRIIEDSGEDSDTRTWKVLDMCASPGGKTTAMLNALKGKYEVVANEFDRKRAGILKENIEKWGDPNVIITNSPTSNFASVEGYYDIVAVDAPCSGEGMMRREPVARTQWSTNLITQCALLQRDILKHAIATLKPGGWLIYSTCTFNREENEENVAFLKESFGLVPIMSPRHFLPHREKCEGLFVAAFRKPGEQTIHNGELRGLLGKAGIRIVSAGIEQSLTKGNLEIPSSKKVLDIHYDSEEFPIVELKREEAVSYLRRNTLVLPEGTPAGYVCVSYEGYPLGLVKNIGNRSNNLYPTEWRILT